MFDCRHKNFLEYLLAFHCTPTLAGIKCANLFSVDVEKYFNMKMDLQNLSKVFEQKGIFFKELCFCKKKILILAYNERLLEKTLNDQEHISLLKDENYPIKDGLGAILNHLSHRLKIEKDFPHEIGIFLGYPIEDVLGFKRNFGQNYKFSGYWKVYGDENYAKQLFEKYTRCRNNVCGRLNNGMLLEQIFRIA